MKPKKIKFDRRDKRTELSRSDFERELIMAQQEKRVPMLTGAAAGIDLSGMDFRSEYKSPYGPHSGVFIGIDLRNANLRGCIFERSDFASANLRGADLSRANLREANLYSALLQGANLAEVDLSGANLVSAEFSGTNLASTVFRDARFGETTILETDLSSAIDLAVTDHYSSSAIDSQSLRLTASGLADQPEYARQDFLRFLAAVGLDDEFIPAVRSWIGRPIEYHSIFVSHSSLDKNFARKIYRDLQALGIRCWLDEKQIHPGDSIMEEVDRGIKLWDRLLLICSRNSLSPSTGWWVEQELERALAKERDFRRSGSQIGTIIPITVDDYIFTDWSSRYRATVLERKVGDFRNADADAYAGSLRQLVAALDPARHS